MTATAQHVGLVGRPPYVAGDHRVLRFSATEGADGSPMNLVGASIRWRLFPWPTGPKHGTPSTESIVSKSLGSGIAVADPGSGVFEVTVLPEDTASLVSAEQAFAMYWHEAEVIDVSGRVYTVANGYFVISFQRVI